MAKRLTNTVLAALVGLLLLGLVGGGVLWWRDARLSDFQRASALAPPDSVRLSWTDWAAVRDQLDVELDAASPNSELEKLLDRGYDADLTSTSALVESASLLQTRFGFSPASVDWELFSQGPRGAVVMLHLPDEIDFSDLQDQVEELGYTRPSSEVGVWNGGEDLLSRIGSGLTPELQYLAFLADERLLLTSDKADFLGRAVQSVQDADGVQDDLAATVDASAQAISASVYDGTYTCTALAMSQADDSDQQQAAELVASAGKVSPIRSFAMSIQPDRTVRVVMAFANDDQARANADSRAVLAAGPAPGQGGDFSDRFEVDSVVADGSLVRMDLAPREGTYVLSDLSTGPVLFATC